MNLDIGARLCAQHQPQHAGNIQSASAGSSTTAAPQEIRPGSWSQCMRKTKGGSPKTSSRGRVPKVEGVRAFAPPGLKTEKLVHGDTSPTVNTVNILSFTPLNSTTKVAPWLRNLTRRTLWTVIFSPPGNRPWPPRRPAGRDALPPARNSTPE